MRLIWLAAWKIKCHSLRRLNTAAYRSKWPKAMAHFSSLVHCMITGSAAHCWSRHRGRRRHRSQEAFIFFHFYLYLVNLHIITIQNGLQVSPTTIWENGMTDNCLLAVISSIIVSYPSGPLDPLLLQLNGKWTLGLVNVLCLFVCRLSYDVTKLDFTVAFINFTHCVGSWPTQ